MNTSKLEKIVVGTSLGILLLASVLPNKMYENSKIGYGHFAAASAVVVTVGFRLCLYNNRKINKSANYQI